MKNAIAAFLFLFAILAVAVARKPGCDDGTCPTR